MERLFDLLLAIPALVAGLTVHEFAHAWMADRKGDDLARREGRLTLDPLAHLDLFGTIFIVLSFMVGFLVGWAKPVPVHPGNMRNPRLDSMWVALAGPISNLMQVPIWTLALALYGFVATRAGWIPNGLYLFGSFLDGSGSAITSGAVAEIIGGILIYGIVLNIGMATFNMIPFPPLDGHWVLQALGPPAIGQFFDMVRPYSFIVLLVLINVRIGGTGLLDFVLAPAYRFAYSLAAFALGAGWVSM